MARKVNLHGPPCSWDGGAKMLYIKSNLMVVVLLGSSGRAAMGRLN